MKTRRWTHWFRKDVTRVGVRKKTTEPIIGMIGLDLQPLSVVEDAGFNALMNVRLT